MLFLKDTVFDLLSAVKTVFILSPTAWVHTPTHTCSHTHKNTLVWACLVKRKIPQLGEDFSFSRPFSLFFFFSLPQTDCSVILLRFFPLVFLVFIYLCNFRPFYSAPSILRQGGQCAEMDREGQAVVGCTLAQHGRHAQGWGQFARRHWLACLRQRLRLGEEGERRQAKLAGREKKERGFTTLKRVGIPPEPFPHLAGSCENNCLAFTLSTCRWSPSYESALRAASGGESGGLVISCTANMSILYRDTLFLMLGKPLRVASSLIFLFVLCSITDIHMFYPWCLVAPCDTLTNKGMSVSCFSRVDLPKTLCWCLELRGRLLPWPVSRLHLLFHTWSAFHQPAEHQQQPTPPPRFPHPPLLPSLPSPWRRSWRAAWPPWIGFLN